MKTGQLWALALLPFALAACGGEEADEGMENGAVVMDTAMTGAPAAAPMDTAMAAGAMGGGNTVQLAALNSSGVTGQMMLAPMGTETQVMVTLNGLAPNSAHAGHIHSGSCDNLGPVVVPLQEITADAGGTGTMTTTVAVDPATAMNGQHLVAYHQDPGEDHGPPVACAGIPMQGR